MTATSAFGLGTRRQSSSALLDAVTCTLFVPSIQQYPAILTTATRHVADDDFVFQQDSSQIIVDKL